MKNALRASSRSKLLTAPASRLRSSMMVGSELSPTLDRPYIN